MHAFGMIVLWTAVQATLIFFLIAVVLRFARKSEPLWRSQVIVAGILAVLLVSACGFSPWPNWSAWWESQQTQTEDLEPSISKEQPETADAEQSITAATTEKAAQKTASGLADQTTVSPLSAAWAAFLDEVQRPRPVAFEEAPEHRSEVEAGYSLSIGSLIGVVFLVGAGLGLARLFAGIWLLRREVARSLLIQDERIDQAIRGILGDVSPRFPITIRVSGRLQTAATTGILRPVILLPGCWTNWDDDDLHAVLAHELNHILRNDCLTTFCAEVARVLHFYHPLMHWLANRLRLEQELAADAHAAQFLGGQNRYLCILAEMALSESSRAPAWPARAFLPSHRTLIRRIEMLRKSPLTERRTSRFWQTATMACLGLATIFALGLRDRAGNVAAQEPDAAQTPPTIKLELFSASKPAKVNEAFPLTYVPDDALAVFGIRPQALLKNPSLKPLADVFLESEELAKPLGIPLEQIEQVVWSFGLQDTVHPEPMLIAGMIRTSGKLNLETLKEEITPEADTGFYGGQLYLRQRGRPVGPAFWLANEQTLIISDTEAGLKQAIDARNLSVNPEKRIPVWEEVADQVVASYANFAAFRQIMAPGGRRMPPRMGLNPMFGPLYNDVETVVGGVSFGKEIEAQLTFHSNDAEGALKVKQTLDAMLVLGRNMVEQNQQMIGQLPERERAMIGSLLTIGQEVMKSIEVKRGVREVIVSAELSPKAVAQLTTALVPAVIASNDAAKRARSQNNLKQIGLAFHNYHDVHRKMPRPVMMGPDGKTPHSWRVAILPYFEQQELYNQYRFDEPWDSEHNKTLLAKMPEIYRHPKDKQDSTNTSYFGLVGENTLLGNNEKDISFRDVIDGTSNTLMVVEAKRDVPWTKPDDIAYESDWSKPTPKFGGLVKESDRSKPLPKLGGWFKDGFVALFGDGSARFLKDTIDKTTLQNLIERNDGNPVNYDEFTDRPRERRFEPPATPTRARGPFRDEPSAEPAREQGLPGLPQQEEGGADGAGLPGSF